MNADDWRQIGVDAGVSSTGLALLALLVRKLWRVASNEVVDTIKDRAETRLYETLRQQIDGLSREVANAREEVVSERKALNETLAAQREEFEMRIEKLEAEVMALNYKRRQAQEVALQAYILLRTRCPDCDSAKQANELIAAIFTQ